MVLDGLWVVLMIVIGEVRCFDYFFVVGVYYLVLIWFSCLFYVLLVVAGFVLG